MNGGDGTTAFLPLGSEIVGQINHDRLNIGQFLTREQANYVYKKVETGETINVDTIQQEIEQENQLNRIDDTTGKLSHTCYIWVFIYVIIRKLCYYLILCLSIRVLKLST